MAAADYAECERRVLLSEGGYTNDPRDPGGPTNWGITITDARLYWKPHATATDVRAMPRSVAVAIYKPKYWDALDCDNLPAGVDYSVFDYGVNSGIARSGRVLRHIVGLGSNQWHVDADVLEALKKFDPLQVIERLNKERLTFLHGLRTWPHFGKGWGARVKSVQSYSDFLATSVAKQSVPAPYTHPETAPAMAKAPAEAEHPIHILPLIQKVLNIAA